jgi:hypothetical protein
MLAMVNETIISGNENQMDMDFNINKHTCDSSVRFSRMDSTSLWNLLNSVMSFVLKFVILDRSSMICFVYF